MARSMKQLIESGIAGAFFVPDTAEEKREVGDACRALDELLTDRDNLQQANKALMDDNRELRKCIELLKSKEAQK